MKFHGLVRCSVEVISQVTWVLLELRTIKNSAVHLAVRYEKTPELTKVYGRYFVLFSLSYKLITLWENTSISEIVFRLYQPPHSEYILLGAGAKKTVKSDNEVVTWYCLCCIWNCFKGSLYDEYIMRRCNCFILRWMCTSLYSSFIVNEMPIKCQLNYWQVNTL